MDYQGEYEALKLAQLVARKLDGKLSSQETVLLDELLTKSPAYKKTYEQLLEEHRDFLFENDLSSNATDALQRVLQRHNDVKVKRRFFIGYAAAIIIGLLAMGLGIYNWTVKEKVAFEPVNILASDVQPGGNRAVLSFSNGQSLELSEEKARITNHNGQIAYQDGERIIKADPTEYVTLSTPNGGQYQVILPDGTNVWLNAGSSIRYPTVFQGDQRQVELKGEAYFEVVHNSQVPFIVQTQKQSVRVLGTQFNISSYEDDPATLTTLVEGSIRITQSKNGQSALLTPGQQAIIQDKNFKVRKVSTTDYTAWKDGFIILNGANLQQTIRKIERWYDVEFDPIESANTTALSGVIPRNINLSDVLNALETYTGIKYVIEGRRVRISQ